MPRRAVAQLVRVPVSKTGGWGFESLLPCSRPTVKLDSRTAVSARRYEREECGDRPYEQCEQARATDAEGRAGRAPDAFSRLGLWWRQIVAELRKVIWPTRKELVAYTTVTLMFAVFMVALVAGLDFGANWLVLRVFG